MELDSEEITLIAPNSKIETELLAHHQIEQANDPYIQLLNKRIELSYINSKLDKAGYYPTLSLNSSYGTNYSSRRYASAFSSNVMPLWNQMNQNRSLYLGISLSYTLYNKFATRANIKKSQIQTENLTLEKDKVLRDRKQTIEQARLEYLASLEERKLYKQRMRRTRLIMTR
ncbi:MAG TPA: TolC family protein [Sphingobacterium sp.]|nr:TolC family protein [Sphingobacterium sp.]